MDKLDLSKNPDFTDEELEALAKQALAILESRKQARYDAAPPAEWACPEHGLDHMDLYQDARTTGSWPNKIDGAVIVANGSEYEETNSTTERLYLYCTWFTSESNAFVNCAAGKDGKPYEVDVASDDVEWE